MGGTPDAKLQQLMDDIKSSSRERSETAFNAETSFDRLEAQRSYRDDKRELAASSSPRIGEIQRHMVACIVVYAIAKGEGKELPQIPLETAVGLSRAGLMDDTTFMRHAGRFYYEQLLKHIEKQQNDERKFITGQLNTNVPRRLEEQGLRDLLPPE